MTRKTDFNPITHIALYIRVSTDEQAEFGHSLLQQQEHLVQIAKNLGYNDFEIYQDDGYSAKSLQRPAMKRLIENIKEGFVKGVLTTKIDRLTRKNKDFSYLLDLFDRYSVFYKAANQNFEVSTATGKLLAQMLSVVAEFEREMIGERVYENLYRLAKNGKLITKPPFGYQIINGALVIKEQEAYWVRQGRDLLLSGKGARFVSHFFNENGVFTSHGNPWSANSVRSLFQNPLLMGELRWNVRKGGGTVRKKRDPSDWIVIPDSAPSLFTREEFQILQARFNRNTKIAPRAREGARLLSGIAKCGFCQGPMHAGWQCYKIKDGMHKHPTYRCGTYAASKGCSYINRVNSADLDEFVIQQIMNLVNEPYPFVQAAENKKERLLSEFTHLTQSVAQMETRSQKLIEAYTLGILTPDELQIAKNRLLSNKEDKERRISQISELIASETPQEAFPISSSSQTLDDLHPLMGNESAKRAAVLELIEEVVVYRRNWKEPVSVDITWRL